jgi:hypothetical protein
MRDGQQRRRFTEAAFRRANLTLEETYRGATWGDRGDPGPSPFICECSSTRCTAIVQLTLDEFEEFRDRPDQFVVVPGHVVSGFKRVVAETDRFAVLEADGDAAPVEFASSF